VRVQDVGDEANGLAQLDDRTGEEREALEVVVVRISRWAVEIRPIEETMVLDEVDAHVAARQPP
jgi:hypothetical protein